MGHLAPRYAAAGGVTIEYMEMFPYNLPNSPVRNVGLISRWGCLYGNGSAS